MTSPTNPGVETAPPGIVLKINHINGNPTTVPSLLDDAEMFGYDQNTGEVVRFALTPTPVASSGQPNMSSMVGQPDLAFQVAAPGSTAPVALSVGRDGARLVLMVDTGSQISVYDATYGTSLGSFTIPAGFDALASTDSVSVIGSVASNQLQMIDVAASLAAGTAQLPVGQPANYTPSAGFSLVGGLTGLVGSNQVYGTIAATFNSFQPLQTELGLLTVSTSTSTPTSSGVLQLNRKFSTVSQQALKSQGSYVPVVPSNNPNLIGVSMGSMDSSLVLNTVSTNSATLFGPVSLTNRGSIKLNITDPITDLTEAFRPDLSGSTTDGTGPALIDVQGDIQSLRGLTANGLVLNDTGNLNLIRTGQISNSTILAQPIGHVDTPQVKRVNTTLLSSNNRAFRMRGGVTLVAGLYQIGPLSHLRPAQFLTGRLAPSPFSAAAQGPRALRSASK